MRKALPFAFLSLAIAVGPAGAGDKEHISWVKKYADGIKAAQEAKKPIFIDFMTTW